MSSPVVAPSLGARHFLPAMQIRYVDGPRLRRSLLAATEYARSARVELNRINVFPVPDGDTGTNLALTARAIADHLQGVHDRDVAGVAREAAQAAVLGARGNCGMMLSQFLLGFAEHLEDRDRISAMELAHAFQAGAETLQQALERPIEGTILTVIRDSAQVAVAAASMEPGEMGAEAAGNGGDADSARATDVDVSDLMNRVVEGAQESLERTPDLLPALREAGVVDAGAKGFVSLLEGVHRYIHGESLVVEVSESLDEDDAPAVARVDYPGDEEQFRYCTEALVRGPALPEAEVVRGRLRELGDSLIVIRTGDALKVHIHADEPETVFGILREYGRLVTHKAEDLKEQHRTVEEAAARHVQLARRPVGIVTDSACDLPAEVLQAHGIRMVPLQLVSGDESYRDRIDISADEFYARLAAAGSEADGEDGGLYTTSQPSPGAFKEGFEDAAQDAEELVAVVLGSGLSGTFGSAETAAGFVEDTPIHMVDTQGLSLLEGLLVLKAAELSEQAMKASEIADELRRIRKRSGILLTLDRYDRLLASGRVGRGTALVGHVFGIKPILAVDQNGKVVRAGQALGRRRVLPALMKALEREIPDDAEKIRFGVVHVGCPEVLPRVVGALEARWPEAEVLTNTATPVIATHVGIGAWAVAFMVED